MIDYHNSHSVGEGAKHRFHDRFSGDYLDSVRKAHSPGLMLNYGKRFCESCQTCKPKGKRKAVKGWRCDDCLAAKRGES